MSPKKESKVKNKRLLTELELKGHADTKPLVSADFNGNPNLISNPESFNNIQATINSAYSTEDSAQPRESREIVDIDN